MEYVKKQKLAGVMVWSIDTDDFGARCRSLHSDMEPLNGFDFPLMKSINAALANDTKSPDSNKLNSSSMQLISNIVFVILFATVYF